MGGIANFNPSGAWEVDRDEKLRALSQKEELEREALAGLPRRRLWQWRAKRRDLKEHLNAAEPSKSPPARSLELAVHQRRRIPVVGGRAGEECAVQAVSPRTA